VLPSAPWALKLRPLSDIREATEPSLTECFSKIHHIKRSPSLKHEITIQRKLSMKDVHNTGGVSRKGSQHNALRQQIERKGLPSNNKLDTLITANIQVDQSSSYSVSLDNVPTRSPSKSRPDLRERSLPQLRSHEAETPKRENNVSFSVINPTHSNSPIKEFEDDMDRMRINLDRSSRSRTLVRTHDPNIDILEFPIHRHPRIKAELHLGATLFVGGGSIEGYVRVVVSEFERSRHKRHLAISRISIDLLGVEEISGPKRSVFINLTTELIDSDNPPPHNMVESLKQISPIDAFWLLAPSVSNMPFYLTLPLDVGPPPFQSRLARIRYVLGVTLLIRDQGKQYLIRTSQDISVISVYDRMSCYRLLAKLLTTHSRKSTYVSPFSSYCFR
jgi:hypothetical protein